MSGRRRQVLQQIIFVLCSFPCAALRSVCHRQVRLAIEKERMIDVIKDCLGSMSVLAVSCCGVMQEDLESDDWVVAAADLPAMLLMQSVSCGPARFVHSLI